ncbi:acyltransferase family protein [Acinetobacter soli]|uniref:acyltransferase family protein n=1 Tax=Acinetobacter soli TaxID=487316 RepID=UPI00280EE9BB|nr:acyltransferase family protein [Acinetobacter soli]
MSRMPGLDLLRSLLILEGIFYHASLVFSPHQWIYSSPNYNSYSLTLFFYFFHLFRMETFFFLAGFFSTLVIQKKGINFFLNDRARRLVIPFFLSLLLICIPQYYFVDKYVHKINEYKLENLLSHLWFLSILVIFIFSQIFYIRKKITLSKIYFIFFIFFSIFLHKPLSYFFNRVFIDFSYLGFIISNALKYISFYIIGIYIFNNIDFILKKIKENLFKLITISTFTSLILIFQYYLFLKGSWHNISNLIQKPYKIILEPSLMFINAISITIILFYFFSKMNFKSRYIDFTIKSSLVIYLIHHPIIIMTAYYFDYQKLSYLNYYLIIVSFSFVIPTILYVLLRKNIVFQIVFGLKREVGITLVHKQPTQ